jgi:hypothetical protein
MPSLLHVNYDDDDPKISLMEHLSEMDLPEQAFNKEMHAMQY